MDLKLNIGKKTKWALIGLVMFMIGLVFNVLTDWEHPSALGLITIVILGLSIILEIGLFFAALAADFDWSE